MQWTASWTNSLRKVHSASISPTSHAQTTTGPNVLVDLVEKLEPSGQIIERGTATSGVFGHRLQFVIFYADFHGARMKGALRGAADALVRLFDEGIAPRTWWGVLLLDALPLLNDSAFLLLFFLKNVGAELILRQLPRCCSL